MEIKKGELFIITSCDSNESANVLTVGTTLVNFDTTEMYKKWSQKFGESRPEIQFNDWLVSEKIIEPLPFKYWSY